MKKTFVLLCFLLMDYCLYAQVTIVQFNQVCTSGQTIYYRQTAQYSQTVEVISAITYGIVANPPQYSGDVIIPSTVTHLGVTYSVTKINGSAFSANYGLTAVTIPSTVISIGASAFSYCTALASITLQGYPPSIESNSFVGVGINIPVIIPCGTLSVYQSSAYWNAFNHFVEGCYTITAIPSNYERGGVTGGGTYNRNESVTLTAIPFQGYQFIGWSNGSQQNPLTFNATQSGTYIASFSVGNLPRDTVYSYIHDTTYINTIVHDTAVIHDTTYINNYIHDTTVLTLHDTTYIDNYIHDTTILTLHDTTYINNYIHDTTIVTEIDTFFIFNTDTIIIDRTDTIYIFDTVYIHDTIHLEVGDVEGIRSLKLYHNGIQIVVEGSAGMPVRLYDIIGRLLATRQEEINPLYFDTPTSGVYLVQVGDAPARRIVVR